jgi:nucleotide-binding universal stress UspA family protein
MTRLLQPRRRATAKDAPRVDSLGRPVERERVVQGGPLLVAVDGSRSAGAALRFAGALARNEGKRVEALFVENSVTDIEGITIGASALREEPCAFESQLERVRQQACAFLPGDDWAMRVEFGRVAPMVARAAAESDASMIIVGLSSHHPARRTFIESLASRVIRYADVPVVAVEARTRQLPRTIVAGVDFGESSVRAACAAAMVLASPGKLVLAHVPLPTNAYATRVERSVVFEAGIRDGFRRLERELQREGLTVVTRILEGRPGEALLRLAHDEHAELIAVGSHGPRLIERVLIGSVPLQLLRAADCSILLAPPTNAVSTP